MCTSWKKEFEGWILKWNILKSIDNPTMYKDKQIANFMNARFDLCEILVGSKNH